MWVDDATYKDVSGKGSMTAQETVKLTKELSKKATPDMSIRWKANKEKMNKSNRIKGLADRIYLENRKGPYHFDTHQEYNEYDLMCRKKAMTEAIRRIVAEDMAKDE